MRKLWKIVQSWAICEESENYTLDANCRSLEGTIINYIHSCSLWRDDLFGGGPISVHYSIRKLQYVIENEWLNHTKICKNCLRRNINSCILRYNKFYMDLKAISCRIE